MKNSMFKIHYRYVSVSYKIVYLDLYKPFLQYLIKVNKMPSKVSLLIYFD